MRSLPRNRVMGEQVPFGQRHTYISAHPMEAMLAEEYFLSDYNVFFPGDTVRVIQVRRPDIDNIRDNQVIAYIDLLVVESSRKGVVFHPEGEVVLIPLLEGDSNPVQMKWNPGKQKYEVWAGSQIVYEDRDKNLARGAMKEMEEGLSRQGAENPPAKKAA